MIRRTNDQDIDTPTGRTYASFGNRLSAGYPREHEVHMVNRET